MTRTGVRSHLRAVVLAAVGTALIATSTPVSVEAGRTAPRQTRLRTQATLALPGVVLPPGDYTFELASPLTSHGAVQVRRGGPTGQPVFLGLTNPVKRPQHLRGGQVLDLREVRAGEPVPIAAWYPEAGGAGHAFVY